MGEDIIKNVVKRPIVIILSQLQAIICYKICHWLGNNFPGKNKTLDIFDIDIELINHSSKKSNIHDEFWTLRWDEKYIGKSFQFASSTL